MDPVEYFGWLYGKGFFFHHPYWGAVIVGCVFGIFAFGVSASLWLMGAERYRERHAPTIAQPITPAPAVKASDTVPTVLEKVEPPHSVEPIPSIKPIPHKASPPFIKKDVPIQPKEIIPDKPLP